MGLTVFAYWMFDKKRLELILPVTSVIQPGCCYTTEIGTQTLGPVCSLWS